MPIWVVWLFYLSSNWRFLLHPKGFFLLSANSERTHRLCTRAGMLEKFLREPTLLTDDDVMELLTFLFHDEAVQRKLDTLIEKRKKTLTTDGSENPLF